MCTLALVSQPAARLALRSGHSARLAAVAALPARFAGRSRLRQRRLLLQTGGGRLLTEDGRYLVVGVCVATD